MSNEQSYPRVLNGQGCLFGRHLREDLAKCEALFTEQLAKCQEGHKERIDDMEQKLDKILWALVLAAIGFGGSAVLLGVNLATP